MLRVPVEVATVQKKSAVLVVVWCYKVIGDREQDLWKYWLPEGWFRGGMTSLWVMAASAKRVNWRRNEALTWLYLVPWPILWCAVCRRNFKKHFWSTPLTRISIDVADSSVFLYCSSGLWAFFQAGKLIYDVVTKIFSYVKLDPWRIIHILGFITPNFLTICLMIIGANYVIYLFS
jgi:hypothetical protein